MTDQPVEADKEQPEQQDINFVPHHDLLDAGEYKGIMEKLPEKEQGKVVAFALAEFIDNSIAATVDNTGPRDIQVRFIEDTVEKEAGHPLTYVVILDNGKGMDIKEIETFATFAKAPHRRNISIRHTDETQLHRYVNSGISKYGVGAKQAAMFLGDRVVVLTRPESLAAMMPSPKCYNCFEKGHIAGQCPKKCRVCEGKHKLNKCPDKGKKEKGEAAKEDCEEETAVGGGSWFYDFSFSKSEFERLSTETGDLDVYKGKVTTNKSGGLVDCGYFSEKVDKKSRAFRLLDEQFRKHIEKHRTFTMMVLTGIHLPCYQYIHNFISPPKGKEEEDTIASTAAQIYHFYTHGYQGRRSQRQRKNKDSRSPKEASPQPVDISMGGMRGDSKHTLSLKDIEQGDLISEMLARECGSFEFQISFEHSKKYGYKELYGEAPVVGILFYFPFVNGNETNPVLQALLADNDANAELAESAEQQASERRDLFQVYWNGRWIPFGQVGVLTNLFPTSDTWTRCRTRVQGLLFMNERYQPSRNKLNFSLPLANLLSEGEITQIRRRGEKSEPGKDCREAKAAFEKWLDHCNREFDKDMEFKDEFECKEGEKPEMLYRQVMLYVIAGEASKGGLSVKGVTFKVGQVVRLEKKSSIDYARVVGFKKLSQGRKKRGKIFYKPEPDSELGILHDSPIKSCDLKYLDIKSSEEEVLAAYEKEKAKSNAKVMELFETSIHKPLNKTRKEFGPILTDWLPGEQYVKYIPVNADFPVLKFVAKGHRQEDGTRQTLTHSKTRPIRYRLSMQRWNIETRKWDDYRHKKEMEVQEGPAKAVNAAWQFPVKRAGRRKLVLECTTSSKVPKVEYYFICVAWEPRMIIVNDGPSEIKLGRESNSPFKFTVTDEYKNEIDPLLIKKLTGYVAPSISVKSLTEKSLVDEPNPKEPCRVAVLGYDFKCEVDFVVENLKVCPTPPKDKKICSKCKCEHWDEDRTLANCSQKECGHPLSTHDYGATKLDELINGRALKLFLNFHVSSTQTLLVNGEPNEQGQKPPSFVLSQEVEVQPGAVFKADLSALKKGKTASAGSAVDFVNGNFFDPCEIRAVDRYGHFTRIGSYQKKNKSKPAYSLAITCETEGGKPLKNVLHYMGKKEKVKNRKSLEGNVGHEDEVRLPFSADGVVSVPARTLRVLLTPAFHPQLFPPKHNKWVALTLKLKFGISHEALSKAKKRKSLTKGAGVKAWLAFYLRLTPSTIPDSLILCRLLPTNANQADSNAADGEQVGKKRNRRDGSDVGSKRKKVKKEDGDDTAVEQQQTEPSNLEEAKEREITSLEGLVNSEQAVLVGFKDDMGNLMALSSIAPGARLKASFPDDNSVHPFFVPLQATRGRDGLAPDHFKYFCKLDMNYPATIKAREGRCIVKFVLLDDLDKEGKETSIERPAIELKLKYQLGQQKRWQVQLVPLPTGSKQAARDADEDETVVLGKELGTALRIWQQDQYGNRLTADELLTQGLLGKLKFTLKAEDADAEEGVGHSRLALEGSSEAVPLKAYVAKLPPEDVSKVPEWEDVSLCTLPNLVPVGCAGPAVLTVEDSLESALRGELTLHLAAAPASNLALRVQRVGTYANLIDTPPHSLHDRQRVTLEVEAQDKYGNRDTKCSRTVQFELESVMGTVCRLRPGTSRWDTSVPSQIKLKEGYAELVDLFFSCDPEKEHTPYSNKRGTLRVLASELKRDRDNEPVYPAVLKFVVKPHELERVTTLKLTRVTDLQPPSSSSSSSSSSPDPLRAGDPLPQLDCFLSLSRAIPKNDNRTLLPTNEAANLAQGLSVSLNATEKDSKSAGAGRSRRALTTSYPYQPSPDNFVVGVQPCLGGQQVQLRFVPVKSSGGVPTLPTTLNKLVFSGTFQECRAALSNDMHPKEQEVADELAEEMQPGRAVAVRTLYEWKPPTLSNAAATSEEHRYLFRKDELTQERGLTLILTDDFHNPCKLTDKEAQELSAGLRVRVCNDTGQACLVEGFDHAGARDWSGLPMLQLVGPGKARPISLPDQRTYGIHMPSIQLAQPPAGGQHNPPSCGKYILHITIEHQAAVTYETKLEFLFANELAEIEKQKQLQQDKDRLAETMRAKQEELCLKKQEKEEIKNQIKAQKMKQQQLDKLLASLGDRQNPRPDVPTAMRLLSEQRNDLDRRSQDVGRNASAELTREIAEVARLVRDEHAEGYYGVVAELLWAVSETVARLCSHYFNCSIHVVSSRDSQAFASIRRHNEHRRGSQQKILVLDHRPPQPLRPLPQLGVRMKQPTYLADQLRPNTTREVPRVAFDEIVSKVVKNTILCRNEMEAAALRKQHGDYIRSQILTEEELSKIETGGIYQARVESVPDYTSMRRSHRVSVIGVAPAAHDGDTQRLAHDVQRKQREIKELTESLLSSEGLQQLQSSADKVDQELRELGINLKDIQQQMKQIDSQRVQLASSRRDRGPDSASPDNRPGKRPRHN